MTKAKYMKQIICPECRGKGFYYYHDKGLYKQGCEVCLGKGLIKPGEPAKRFKVRFDS